MEGKYLPIGTVCKLKGATNPLMIIGFCMKKSENDEVMNDYAGCPYPTGIISSQINFLFNHDQIEEILYRGFENDLEKKFKIQMLEELERMGVSSGNEVSMSTVTNEPVSTQSQVTNNMKKVANDELLSRLPQQPSLDDLRERLGQ